MIPRFSDHAANERTFLAWVRTAIAVMAFGFLLERFDLFLAYAVRSLGKQIPALHVRASEWLGLSLLGFGALIVLLAAIRFNKNRKLISAEDVHSYGTTRLEQAMAPVLVAMAVFLLIYVARQVIALS